MLGALTNIIGTVAKNTGIVKGVLKDFGIVDEKVLSAIDVKMKEQENEAKRMDLDAETAYNEQVTKRLESENELRKEAVKSGNWYLANMRPTFGYATLGLIALYATGNVVAGFPVELIYGMLAASGLHIGGRSFEKVKGKVK